MEIIATAVLNVTLIITNFSLSISDEFCQYSDKLKNDPKGSKKTVNLLSGITGEKNQGKGGAKLTNIVDGMDDARFRTEGSGKNLKVKKINEEKKMQPVLRNLKNGS